MLIHSIDAGQTIQLQTPAKVNLLLELLGKRPDGYHEISTVMCPISLWDDLEIEIRPDNSFELILELPEDCSSDDAAWQIPTDSSNLVVRAAQATFAEVGVKSGCTLRLKKMIPAAAGLGGGSGNAAGAVVGCLALMGRFERQLAAKICSRLGSDVNFFLGDSSGFGLMHATGRGESVRPLAARPELELWLLHPPQGCATSQVYARYQKVNEVNKTGDFLAACQTGQTSKIGAAMFNALQLPASELNAWISVQLSLLQEFGCGYRLMSGSGSSVFAIDPPQDLGLFESFKRHALTLGIRRVFRLNAWYGPSIESQLVKMEP